MSSVRSDPGHRLRHERFTRTNSGNLELDLNLARDELRRERSRERRWRGHIEDDDSDYYRYVYEGDDPMETTRRRRRSTERRPLSPPRANLDRIIVRPMRDLHDIPSSPPGSRSGTRSSAPSQARGPVISIVSRHDRHDRHDRLMARIEELDRIRRDNERNAIISRLSAEVTKESGQNIVVYYYFDRSSGCKPYQAISSLLRQICVQKDIPLPKFLAEMETKGLDAANEISDNDGIRLANLVSDFLSIQSRFKRVYICLDGLEECDDLLTLIQILRRISAIQDIRLALTSRSRVVEQCVAVSIGRKEIVVQLEDHNSQDIRRYLESVLKCQRHSYLSDMIGKETRPVLLNQLIEKSGGNFLSAVAQVAQLNRLSSLAEVTDQLEKPPLQLSEVIDLILSRFNDQSPQRSQLALRVLYWLAVARRPLTLRELQQAVAAEPGGNIDDPNRLPPPSVIKTVCMGLVHIDVEKNRVFTTPSALPFYLYQFGNEFARQAREYAAISCLAFLQSDTVAHGPFTSQSQYDETEKKLPFATYASQNWGVHLNNDRDQGSVDRVLENDSLLETLSQLLHVTSQPASVSPRPYDDYPRGFGGRHFGSYFGLTSAFNKWSTQEDWAVARDSWNRSPFHVYLCSPGLYERHAFISQSDFEEVSELVFGGASSEDRSDLMDEDTGTDDKAKPFRHEPVSGLPWKWEGYGHNLKGFRNSVPGKNFKKLFTFSKGEIKVADKDGKTPAHHFITNWSDDIFLHFTRLIYQPGDALNHESDDANTTDDWDSSSDLGIYPEGREFLPIEADKSGRTTLDYACQRTTVAGVIMFGTAEWSREQMVNGFVTAASCGHAALVSSLCEMIDDSPNSEDKDLDLGRAVIEASKRGFTDVVPACRGNVDVARKLLRLDGGAVQPRTPDPDATEVALQSPLHVAAREGHHAVVKLLVEEGFQIDALDGDRRTPLSHACEGGHLKSVEILLTKRRFAGVHIADKNRRTPLSYAAAEGHVAIVATLVGLGGVDPNIKDVEGKTALIHAAQRGHNDTVVVLILLAHNNFAVRGAAMRAFKELYAQFSSRPYGTIAVDVNVKDNEERSAVYYLKRNGASDVARYIVEIGEKPKPKAPVAGDEEKTGGEGVDKNNPAEGPEVVMVDDDSKAS
ncbi:hypothetical protein F4803DRAFT_559087 [Xylaria telfairii]|nr:hypothetical protein F4803DRAFT_559087 [Xylaria telfairii]